MASNTSLPRSTKTPDPVDIGATKGDTIVAVATPPGRGGIAVVRLSGPAAAEICRRLSGRLPEPRLATLAVFRDGEDRTLDRGLLIHFPAPHSFTGESVVELHCHGSPLVTRLIIERCLELGARLARPGEFSERAFLSGQIDLAQAEAIADLIESATESAARSAVRSLEGHFSSQVHALTDDLTRLRIFVEAAIDFPEEEIDFLADQNVLDQLDALFREFTELRRAMSQGKLLRDGLRVVLSGAPNAGKSSLLNRLSREQRAIVTDIPGTTRDVLEQHLDLDGLPVILVDTAGIRDSSDLIEAEGVRRARAERARADLLLQVVDATAVDGFDSDTEAPVITVYNKADLLSEPPAVRDGEVAVSALSGQGIEDLITAIKRHAGFLANDDSQFIARQRHIDALDRARDHVEEGIEQLRDIGAGELLAEELRLAQLAMGEITGEVTSDDLLGLIFSSFCIGK